MDTTVSLLMTIMIDSIPIDYDGDLELCRSELQETLRGDKTGQDGSAIGGPMETCADQKNPQRMPEEEKEECETSPNLPCSTTTSQHNTI